MVIQYTRTVITGDKIMFKKCYWCQEIITPFTRSVDLISDIGIGVGHEHCADNSIRNRACYICHRFISPLNKETLLSMGKKRVSHINCHNSRKTLLNRAKLSKFLETCLICNLQIDKDDRVARKSGRKVHLTCRLEL